jgi:hypothetical protein
MLTKLSKNESVIVLSSGSDILLTTPVVHGYQIDTVNFTTLKEFLDTSSFALYSGSSVCAGKYCRHFADYTCCTWIPD